MGRVLRPRDSGPKRGAQVPKDKRAEWTKARADAAMRARPEGGGVRADGGAGARGGGGVTGDGGAEVESGGASGDGTGGGGEGARAVTHTG